MKKPRLYYTGGSDTCLACRNGWTPKGALSFRCDKHDRDVRNPDCAKCQDWKPKPSEELPVDVLAPS